VKSLCALIVPSYEASRIFFTGHLQHFFIFSKHFEQGFVDFDWGLLIIFGRAILIALAKGTFEVSSDLFGFFNGASSSKV